jgi:hypothetical protein
VSDTNIVTQSTHKKYVKEVSINNQKIEALIDTGSDIYLICVDQYIRVDVLKRTIRFRDVGSGDNVTWTNLMQLDLMTIDKSDYPIHISDMLMKHELLISADFLDTVQITMNAGKIVIDVLKPVPEDKEIHIRDMPIKLRFR